jgi:hypothetical protein
MSGFFKNDEIMFGILQVGAVDRKEALTSVRCKSMMAIMKKAKVGPQRQEVINHIQGIHFFSQM